MVRFGVVTTLHPFDLDSISMIFGIIYFPAITIGSYYNGQIKKLKNCDCCWQWIEYYIVSWSINSNWVQEKQWLQILEMSRNQAPLSQNDLITVMTWEHRNMTSNQDKSTGAIHTNPYVSNQRKYLEKLPSHRGLNALVTLSTQASVDIGALWEGSKN